VDSSWAEAYSATATINSKQCRSFMDNPRRVSELL